jgi:hypothetical protein
MELETYEANLADIALQEQTFYDTKPTQFELELAMASHLASTLASQSCQNGPFTIPNAFPIAPIISNGGKGKKKKSVKFLTYVQVSPKKFVILLTLFHGREYSTFFQSALKYSI